MPDRRPNLTALTAGIPGAELIRRRAEHLCIACGRVEVFAVSKYSDVPWLCAWCEELKPKKATFNHKAHKAEGLNNLDRLLRDDDA